MSSNRDHAVKTLAPPSPLTEGDQNFLSNLLAAVRAKREEATKTVKKETPHDRRPLEDSGGGPEGRTPNLKRRKDE